MFVLAMWFQDATVGFSGSSEKMIAWSLVIIAIALGLQALLYVGIGIAGLIALGKVKKAVGDVQNDIKRQADEIKGKVYPLIESATQISKKAHDIMQTAEGVLADATPKLRTITDHLVDTSRTLRDSAEKVSQTVGDANTKTQKQVARVDGMLTAALNTTSDVIHAIEHGIKVPAQKIAVAATEARFVAEGLLDKLRGLGSGLPFMPQRAEKIPASPAGYRAPVQRSTAPVATPPTTATGPVPLVK